ncbi:YrbL family protein [Halomonas salinarum]|uniref:YrbL family protein n=1 Tax=Halomonas salinarum TaxID=1158993 RepID=UPI0014398928|nr:YrbL family protein [Halomonas salinarum]
MTYCIPEVSEQASLELDDSLRIGRGNKRDCYIHPDDDGQCIKVARHLDRWEECQEQSIVEWYYINHLKARCVPLTHLIDCYGWVNTQYGPGLAMERIQEDSGVSALTLRQALQQGRLNRFQVQGMLDELKTWVTKYAIVIADLNTDNLMVRNNEDGAIFVMVDGFGSRKADWKFTLYQRCLPFSRLKTKRQWERQEVTLFQTVDEILA